MLLPGRVDINDDIASTCQKLEACAPKCRSYARQLESQINDGDKQQLTHWRLCFQVTVYRSPKHIAIRKRQTSTRQACMNTWSYFVRASQYIPKSRSARTSQQHDKEKVCMNVCKLSHYKPAKWQAIRLERRVL